LEYKSSLQAKLACGQNNWKGKSFYETRGTKRHEKTSSWMALPDHCLPTHDRDARDAALPDRDGSAYAGACYRYSSANPYLGIHRDSAPAPLHQ
jgi:hypothetical protein